MHAQIMHLAPSQPLRFMVYEEDGAFIAQCLDVEVVSEGDTSEAAKLGLREALELAFSEPNAVGTNVRQHLEIGEMTLYA